MDNLSPVTTEQKNTYDIYLEYIRHETTLIQGRLVVMATVQSFLFLTYSFAIQQKLSSLTEMVKDSIALSANPKVLAGFMQLDIFMVAVALAGIGLALITRISVMAAVHSADRAHAAMERLNDIDGFEFLKIFPGAQGGGDANFREQGRVAATVTPLFIAVIWTVILIVTIVFILGYY